VLALKVSDGRALRWVAKSVIGVEYELRDKADVFGTISQRSTALAAAASAQTLAHRWEIWQSGFLIRPKILLDPRRNADTAIVFRPRFFGRPGGRLESGERLSFQATSLLRSRWDWRDEQKEPIVRLEGRVFWSGGCDVRIRADAFARPDLDLLVVLGFYYKHRLESAS
jgi:hypothetical protein